MGRVECESVESHLLALTKFSVADFANCSPNLIEEVRLLLQSVTVPSSASPPRPQDEEGLAPATVPPQVSPPRPQDEEGLAPVTVPPPLSPPRLQDEEGLALQDVKSKRAYEALSKTIKKAKGLVEHGVGKVIRKDLSPAAHDPCVQDIEAAIRKKTSDSQKLRHILVLPILLREYDRFCLLTSRGSLRQFASKIGLTYPSAREAVTRSRKLRKITSYYREPGLRVLLTFTVPRWRGLSDGALEVVARLCQEDGAVTGSIQDLSKFYEQCEVKYNALLRERLDAVLHSPMLVLSTLGTRPDKQARVFVEENEVEEPPVARQGENQRGVKRPHGTFKDTQYSKRKRAPRKHAPKVYPMAGTTLGNDSRSSEGYIVEGEVGSGGEGQVEPALSGGILATDVRSVPISTSDAPDTVEQRDVDVLFGSNQDNLLSNFNLDNLEVHLDQIQPSDFNLDNLRVQPFNFNLDNLEVHFNLDNLGVHPDRPSDFNLDNLETINPAALNN